MWFESYQEESNFSRYKLWMDSGKIKYVFLGRVSAVPNMWSNNLNASFFRIHDHVKESIMEKEYKGF